MLNIEKYKDELKRIGVDKFSVVNGMPNVCTDTKCNECLFKDPEVTSCNELRIDWLCLEYKEPEIDWDDDIDWMKVPTDTDVLVRTENTYIWHVRKFAIYVPNSPEPYRTFFDEEEQINASCLSLWVFCKLANPEDIEKYRKR